MDIQVLPPVQSALLLLAELVKVSGRMESTYLVHRINVWNVNFSEFPTIPQSNKLASTLRSTTTSRLRLLDREFRNL